MISKRFFEKQYSMYSKKNPPLLRGAFLDAGEELPHLPKRFMIEADTPVTGTPAVLDALAVEICHVLMRGMVKTPAPRAFAKYPVMPCVALKRSAACGQRNVRLQEKTKE